MLEGEQDNFILEVEVVELVDQALATDRSRRSGGRSRIDRCQRFRRSGRNFAINWGEVLADTELLSILVHDLDPNQRSVSSACAERGDRLPSDIAHGRRPTVLTINSVFGARANAGRL
ncbi:MAG: hypothetical protein ACLP66_24895 [Polyangia bacterium]